MPERVAYGQLRSILTGLGFQETRSPKRVCLEHGESDTVFLFRPYQASDLVTPAEVVIVRKMLDEKGLLEAETFETMLHKAPA